MKYIPHDYQIRAKQWVIDRPKTGLFLPMGAGKSVITLTAIDELMYDYMTTRRVLVIAPIRVAASTWPSEIKKWDHTKHLRYSCILGTKAQRIAAMKQEADIYLINRENVTWLVDYWREKWPYDMVVIDELSGFKNPAAKRFKALRKVTPFIDRFIGLTGTPTPKGLPDLWSQVYLMDRGTRLGKTLGDFRRNYLIPLKHNGYIVYEWGLQQGAKEHIFSRISDICMSLKIEDYLKLPDCQYLDQKIELSASLRQRYTTFKQEKILQLTEGGVITASNAGVISGKLLQFTAGAVYDEEHEVQLIHDLKLDQLEDLMEAANGEPVMVFYYFKHDYDRIYNRFKDRLSIRSINGQKDVEDWNAGKIDMLLVHPASVGHGLNLQAGGSIIVWFTLPNWNLELYLQANARLHRQGQKNAVRVYHIVISDTVDDAMVRSLVEKNVTQSALIEALKI